MDYSVWCFILASWLAFSGGFEFCIQDDNPIRCGIPPLTDEQIRNIDVDRLEDIRSLLIQRNGTPLALEDNSIDPRLMEPLVELTPNQRAALDRKYGTSSSSDVGTAQRKKRGDSVEACPPSGSQTVFFVLTATDDVCQIQTFLDTNLDCVTPDPSSCNNCCIDHVCVPLTCVNIDGPSIGIFDVILTRCTCCN